MKLLPEERKVELREAIRKMNIDGVEFRHVDFVSEAEADGRDVGVAHVVPRRVGFHPSWSKHLLLQMRREIGLKDGVASDLANVGRGELPHLRSDGVFLDEWLFCVVELEGVISRDGNVQTAGIEDGEGVFGVVEEEGVVGEGRHGDRDLGKVKQVL